MDRPAYDINLNTGMHNWFTTVNEAALPFDAAPAGQKYEIRPSIVTVM
jgi:hypothetical protein